ncbi:MAG: acetyltransferase [Cyclobacteriaceae bacterium]
MIIYGAGGHSCVIIDSLIARNFPINAIFDDDSSKKELFGHAILHQYTGNVHQNESLIIAIGNNVIRKKIAVNIQHTFGIVKDPSAIISSFSQIGIGSVILHRAIVQARSMVGKHVIVNTAAIIEHDCQVGDYAQIGPNATICGSVHIGEGAFIGAGAVIKPGVKIGSWAIVGAGAIVIKDIDTRTMVAGNPAKIIKTTLPRT